MNGWRWGRPPTAIPAGAAAYATGRSRGPGAGGGSAIAPLSQLDECGPEPEPVAPDGGLARTVGRLFSASECGSLVQVMGMGFSRDGALTALIDAQWNVEVALSALLDGAPSQTSGAASPAAGLASAVDPAGPAAPVVLELGYVVLRAPISASALRGHHRCDWDALMRRLDIPRRRWPEFRAGYYIRLYKSQGDAEKLWADQRLALPIPVDPGAAVAGSI